jgi:hypothetical protein
MPPTAASDAGRTTRLNYLASAGKIYTRQRSRRANRPREIRRCSSSSYVRGTRLSVAAPESRGNARLQNESSAAGCLRARAREDLELVCIRTVKRLRHEVGGAHLLVRPRARYRHASVCSSAVSVSRLRRDGTGERFLQHANVRYVTTNRRRLVRRRPAVGIAADSMAPNDEQRAYMGFVRPISRAGSRHK